MTSQRRTNFNDLSKIGLVKIKTDGPDTVLAYGSKPSVGGQSQRIVFNDHPDCDCIVHFHVEKKQNSNVPVVSQYEFECGSHECGRNTSGGLKQFGNLKAVMLDNHGPNIVFNQSIDPQEVIDFIDSNFDLSSKTGGFVSADLPVYGYKGPQNVAKPTELPKPPPPACSDEITKEIAYSLIFERGLHLPVDKEYESKRLKEIAVRRNELFAELAELDKEIIDMNGKK